MKSLVLLLAVLLTGCGAHPEPSLAPALTLPTLAARPDDGAVSVCAGVGLAAVLRGNPNDPRLAWIEQFPGGGGRKDVIWPAGFSARFTPNLEVLDSKGRVVIRGGDFVDGACGSPQPGIVALMPPFLALRLDCGPVNVADCTSGRINQVASANGWPQRDIAEVHFLTADGRYRLLFEDGSQTTGSSSQP